MAPCRTIIELRSVGLSFRKVAYLTGSYITTVTRICKRAAELGIQWPVPAELSDDELSQLVDPTHRAPQKRTGSARQPWMLVNWTPAEVVQVDWAARTIPIYGKEGDATPAYLFVAALPYSDYTFVRASLDMSMLSWLEHHRAMFEFLGGVPLFLSPDNCPTAITFDRTKAPDEDGYRKVNRRYQDLADHYGIIVTPTRTYSPQDKAAVEQAVNNAANRFAGILEQMRFTSIDQLNRTIAELTEVLNGRPMAVALDRSRREIFLSEEAPHLAPLPETPYEGVSWERARASKDAVVRVRGAWYGLPEGCACIDAAVRIGAATVDVYTADRAQLLARHVRREDGSDTFEGFAGRRPDRYKSLAEWAEQNGRSLLAAQWHPTKNAERGPDGVTCRSYRRAWWLCPDCGYEWDERVRIRIARTWDDCPACAGVDLVPGRNDLATLRPDIAAGWHPEKNGCGPADVFPSYDLGVWWRGSECGHEWFCPPAKRTRSAYDALCPFCSGQKALAGFNDVATLAPGLAKLWDKGKNRHERPEDTSVRSKRRVHLLDGPLGDSWMETPRSWLERNGLGHVLEPFDRTVAAAREKDERNAPHTVLDPNAHAKALTRGNRHKLPKEDAVTFEDWCTLFHREDLLREWHPERNGTLAPGNIASGSTASAWWRCEMGHEWRARIRNRQTRVSGCPVCNPRKIAPGKGDLASRGLDFIRLYSPGNALPPDGISARSKEPLLWRCPECGYEWRCTLDEFPGGWALCPKCDGWEPVNRRRLSPGLSDLAARFPKTASCWHPIRNEGRGPQDVLPYSLDEAWWLCPECGHEWREPVATCVKRRPGPCKECNEAAARNAAREREEAKSAKKAAEAERPPRNWKGRSGRRPVEAGENDLASQRPEVAEEWHPTLNGDLKPADVAFKSNKTVWWKCQICGHEWPARICNRALGTGCPECYKRSRWGQPKNRGLLADERPDLAKQWHPAKNGAYTPGNVSAGSGITAWWVCEKGHEWEAAVSRRVIDGVNCHYCSNCRVLAGYNDLASQNPGIAAQWHPTLNGDLKPVDVVEGSRREVWWLCPECGHEWQRSPSNRRSKVGRACPCCGYRPE